MGAHLTVSAKCTCGGSLTIMMPEGDFFGDVRLGIFVAPCEDCLEKSRSAGYDRGFIEATRAAGKIGSDAKTDVQIR